jgi:hypothetical protein
MIFLFIFMIECLVPGIAVNITFEILKGVPE